MVIMGAGTNKKDLNVQRKSIQSIVNQAFDDNVVIANDSQLSNQVTPKQGGAQMINRQNYIQKANNS